jgi:tryptophan-rich sensory protein
MVAEIDVAAVIYRRSKSRQRDRMDSTQPTRKITWRDMDYGAVAVVFVLAASISGQLATTTNWLPWYAALAKPSFNPPNWIFAPVWGGLYLLMALAVWRVIRRPPSPARRWALILFFIQLTLNAAWPWMFFAAQGPLLGLINVVPQWLVLAATMILFFRIDLIAGSALVPLTAWVGYASLLNVAIFWLNR